MHFYATYSVRKSVLKSKPREVIRAISHTTYLPRQVDKSVRFLQLSDGEALARHLLYSRGRDRALCCCCASFIVLTVCAMMKLTTAPLALSIALLW